MYAVHLAFYHGDVAKFHYQTSMRIVRQSKELGGFE